MSIPKHIEKRRNELLRNAMRQAQLGTDKSLAEIRILLRRVDSTGWPVPGATRTNVFNTFCQATNNSVITTS